MQKSLRQILENILEHFDNASAEPTLDVIVDGQQVPGYISEALAVDLDEAYAALASDEEELELEPQ